MITHTLLKYDVFTNDIKVSLDVKDILSEEIILRQESDNDNQLQADSIQNFLSVGGSSYINRCIAIDNNVQDYQLLLNSYERCTENDNITPFNSMYDIVKLYNGPLIYDGQIYDYDQYKYFSVYKKNKSYYDIIESKIKMCPYSSKKIYLYHNYNGDSNVTYTIMLYFLNYLIDLLSTKYIYFLTMMSDDNTNPVVKANTFSTERTMLENKISELKNNSKGIENFKDLVLYAKNNLDIWFGYKTEVENKLINIANTVQNISSDTIYLSEEYYNFNSISTETSIYNLGALSNYISGNNILSSDIVFQKAYKMYINNQEIYLYEYAYYHNNIIIK